MSDIISPNPSPWQMKKNLPFFNNSLDFLFNKMDIKTYITDKIVFAGLKRGSIDQNYNENSRFHRIRDRDCGWFIYSATQDTEHA